MAKPHKIGVDGDTDGSHVRDPSFLFRLAQRFWLDFYLGRLSEGARLPSVRLLARDLGVSPTTALDYYKRLEAQGIVEGRMRSGVFLRRIGIERDRHPRERALFSIVNHVARRLGLFGVPASEFTRLLLLRTGAVARRDFTFGFLSVRESFDLVTEQVRGRLGFAIPMVLLPTDDHGLGMAADQIRRDRSIRCVLTTYLHLKPALALAREPAVDVVVVRLDPPSADILSPPDAGTRHIVTRDRSMALEFRRLICEVCLREAHRPPCGLTAEALDDHSPAAAGVMDCCQRVCTASLDDPPSLARLDDRAHEVYATSTALLAVRRRYGDRKKVMLLSAQLTQETVDDILFHYLLTPGADEDERRKRAAVAAAPGCRWWAGAETTPSSDHTRPRRS